MLAKVSPAFREEVLLLKVDGKGLNPLMAAAKYGHAAAAEIILSYGGRLGNNANTKDLLQAEDNDGVTALHHAARGGHNDVMNALLVLASTLDIDIVNAANLDGSTPLHWAARKNNELGIRMLLHHGADRDARNKWGATPLDNAVYAPSGAYNAIAIISRDKAQIEQALKDGAVASKIRISHDEKLAAEAYEREVQEEKRVEDRTRLKKLNTARVEGWLGWHAEKQDPNLIMPERRMRNADEALERALRPPGIYKRTPPASPDQYGGLPHSPPPGSPERSPTGSPQRSSRSPRVAPPHTPDEHAELLRAVDEAVRAGNHKSGVAEYEDRIQEATRTLRLLKYDKRTPSRHVPPPSPLRSQDEQKALDALESQRVASAVEKAAIRAASPPQIDSFPSHRAEAFAQIQRRVASTSSPRKRRSGSAVRPLTDGPRSFRSTPPSTDRSRGSGGSGGSRATGGRRSSSPATSQRGSAPPSSQRGSAPASAKPRKNRLAPKSPGPKKLLEFDDGGGAS